MCRLRRKLRQKPASYAQGEQPVKTIDGVGHRAYAGYGPGIYYLTMDKAGEIGEGKVFRSISEAEMAYDEGDIGLHSKIRIRMSKVIGGKTVSKLIETTLGKVIFNQPIPQDLGFVDRSNPDNAFALEVDFLVNKKKLGEIIARCIKAHGTGAPRMYLTNLKRQGFKYSTRAVLQPRVRPTIPEPNST
jgi:DNA-directed RNA polymerase subunit beta'